ncbi:MAG: M42 family metallopeptidase [Anaerolineae bacterium]|nr:M42 family metallopeptidase [Anaerolineae bacterium]
MKDLMKRLTEAYGPSGDEEQIRDLIRAEVESLADELRVDTLGNLIAAKKGQGGGKRVMLAAHMDEIGLIISYVDEKGFLRAQPIGGLDLTTLAGGRIVFSDGAVGVIAPENREDFRKEPELSKLYIDVGATSYDEAKGRLGQPAGFLRPFVDLGKRVVAKAFDDRIGCVVLIETLRRLQDTPHEVYFVFSVQEEVGLRGARTGAYGVDPEIGIAVDITASGDTPEARKMAMKLGAGPCIKVRDSGMLAHPGVKDLLIETAEAREIPYQLEVLAAGSTDAAAIQLSRSGVPAGCVSVACRYYHTPSEMVDVDDVENTVRLLVALLEEPIEL